MFCKKKIVNYLHFRYIKDVELRIAGRLTDPMTLESSDQSVKIAIDLRRQLLWKSDQFMKLWGRISPEDTPSILFFSKSVIVTNGWDNWE